ncbi:dihydroorotase [Leuconostoc suionicum]|uniref:dihydroorotase n=1 Tax=Leuconostoc suionicum TaxID=1511761 RepID=UPI00233ED18B|nr:dihydroorotase [Leuconostoc suionicum]MDC2804955.1 dihydroorotase [Leuconostoc suionicum]MDC2822467.1 dihydroorotase [Leuconostoc suionicum]
MQLIKNAKILWNNQLVPRDILIDKGIIQKISDHLENNAATTFDAKGAFLSTGLVDVHVHFREPGFEYKETINSGSKAAARGGFTTVIAMPNLNPVPDNEEKITNQIARNKQNGVIHIEQYGAISNNLTSTQVTNIKGMSTAGAKAFTNDGKGVQTANTMLQAMVAAASVNKPLAAHLEDDTLVHDGVMNEGEASIKLALPGITGLAESSQLARDLVLAKATGVHYHVAHISTKESVELVRIAKHEGVHVTAEVSPHHLLLSEEDINSDNAMFKMNPPLRTQRDREAVIAGLLDGTIDMVATDHAPHGKEEKQKSFRDAPFGITGIETSFQLLYTYLVKNGVMTLETLLERMVTAPVSAFQLQAPTSIVEGARADLALFDLENNYEIDTESFESMGKNSPFIGWEVYGKTLATWVDGEIVYKDNVK